MLFNLYLCFVMYVDKIDERTVILWPIFGKNYFN